MTFFPDVAHGHTLVVVRFRADVAEDILARQWHSSQQVQVETDGVVIWRAWVEDWRPLLPWLLSWGASCQVVAPAEARAVLREEARALAQAYGWFVSHLPGAPGALWEDFLEE